MLEYARSAADSTMTSSKAGRAARGPSPACALPLSLALALGLLMLGGGATCAANQDDSSSPPIVAPGSMCEGEAPGDSIVLFDGSSLDEWVHTDGRAAEWVIDNDAMVVKPNSGSIISQRKFGDAQYHLEFATPSEVDGEGQGRGNSGFYIQGRYEIQILDSYDNETYSDGQCGAIYKQHPPLVNVSRPPGEWQTYDVVFRAARFDESGAKIAPATVTVFHNGVLIHDRAELQGPTGGQIAGESAAPGPIMLQDHGNRTRFRHIWVRPLEH